MDGRGMNINYSFDDDDRREFIYEVLVGTLNYTGLISATICHVSLEI